MSQNYNRQIAVKQPQAGAVIGFIWSQHRDFPQGKLHTRVLRYPRGRVLESVNQAIAVFGSKSQQTLPTPEDGFYIITVDPRHHDLFDMVANAEEPEQAFISRYVLGG